MSEKAKRDIAATKKALAAAAKELMTACGNCDEVTSRRIAARADVNPAMINYCFGSREALLYEVYRSMLGEAQQNSPGLKRLMEADISPKEKLILLHINMMRLMLAGFSYSQAMTKYILLNRSGDMGMESLLFIRDHFNGHKTEEECRLIAFQLTSLNELAVLRHEMFRTELGIDLTDDVQLESFVRSNAERFLG